MRQLSVMVRECSPLCGRLRIAHVQSMNFSDERHDFCSQLKSDHQYNDSPWAGRDEVMLYENILNTHVALN